MYMNIHLHIHKYIHIPSISKPNKSVFRTASLEHIISMLPVFQKILLDQNM